MGYIKGITIEIDGETKGLDAALRGVNTKARNLESELKRVNQALKFNPANLEMVHQKQQILSQSVSQTKTKLDALRQAQAKLKAQGLDETSADYRRIGREIQETERKLKSLIMEQARFSVTASKVGQVHAKFSRLQPAINKASQSMMRMTKVAGGMFAAFATFSLTKAFAKLSTLDEVSAKLEALGHKGKDLSNIMDAATNSVSGTAHGLADMAKVIPGALGAGVQKTDYGLEGYLTRVADLSTFAGKNVSEFGNLMNKALSSGTVNARLLNQFMYAGIPIYNDLADSLGISVEEVKKLTSSGKIGMEELMKATKKYEGMATKLGMSTLTGAGTIMSQTFGNMGVAFLEGAYEPMKNGLIKLVTWLKANMDTVKKWGASFGEGITALVSLGKSGEVSSKKLKGLSGIGKTLYAWLSPVVKIVRTVVIWFSKLSPQTKKLIVGFALLSGPILKASSALITFGGGILKAAGYVKGAVGIIRLFAPAVMGAMGPVGIAIAAIGATVAAITILTKKGTDVNEFVDKISQKIITGINVLAQKIPEIIETIVNVISNNLPKFIEAAVKIITALASGLIKALPVIVKSLPTIIKAIVRGIINLGKQLISVGVSLMKNFLSGIKSYAPKVISNAVGALKKLPSRIRSGIGSLASIGANLVTGLWNGISNKVGWLKSKISGFVGNVKSWLKKFFKIGSPSRLMADEIGRWIPAGVAEGITGNMKSVKNAMSNMTDTIKTPQLYVEKSSSGSMDYNVLAGVLTKALSGVQMTSTLNVDGRVVAETTAPFMETQLNSLTKRANRKFGYI